ELVHALELVGENSGQVRALQQALLPVQGKSHRGGGEVDVLGPADVERGPESQVMVGEPGPVVGQLPLVLQEAEAAVDPAVDGAIEEDPVAQAPEVGIADL